MWWPWKGPFWWGFTAFTCWSDWRKTSQHLPCLDVDDHWPEEGVQLLWSRQWSGPTGQHLDGKLLPGCAAVFWRTLKYNKKVEPLSQEILFLNISCPICKSFSLLSPLTLRRLAFLWANNVTTFLVLREAQSVDLSAISGYSLQPVAVLVEMHGSNA